ncbi:helix-turn-helix domain-containing protein [Streptomyces sp. NPDC019443]|uniref:helix-turn-helix domain-containing protein n=1 Tax=Streptomyces sp. NPDC019443 TaxID=3365061 RepID=UPI0037973090
MAVVQAAMRSAVLVSGRLSTALAASCAPAPSSLSFWASDSATSFWPGVVGEAGGVQQQRRIAGLLAPGLSFRGSHSGTQRSGDVVDDGTDAQLHRQQAPGRRGGWWFRCDDDHAVDINININVIPAKRKMSVGELAERVGITPRTWPYSRTTAPRRCASRTLAALCEVLECRPGDLRWEPEGDG